MRQREWNLQPPVGMLRHQYEKTRLIGTSRSRTGILVLLAAGLVIVLAIGIWMSPGGNEGLEPGAGVARTATDPEGAIGTSGQEAGGENSGPALTGFGNPIHEIETITGTNDGHELVGRRVDLHVPIQQHINDVAFWVGPSGNRVLVVLARDGRDGEMRQRGETSTDGVGRVRAGQRATVSGTIQRVPYAEAMYSWGLTTADRRELMDRPIYIRADSITPNGSGGPAVGTSGTADPAGGDNTASGAGASTVPGATRERAHDPTNAE